MAPQEICRSASRSLQSALANGATNSSRALDKFDSASGSTGIRQVLLRGGHTRTVWTAGPCWPSPCACAVLAVIVQALLEGGAQDYRLARHRATQLDQHHADRPTSSNFRAGRQCRCATGRRRSAHVCGSIREPGGLPRHRRNETRRPGLIRTATDPPVRPIRHVPAWSGRA